MEESKSNLGNRIMVWVVWILVLFAIVFALWKVGTTPQAGEEGVSIKSEVKSDDWYKGKEDAPVVLVEYSDFQCPACGLYYPLIEKLVTDFPDKLKFVYRHFPLSQIHPNAELASRAAESAGLQGKFFEMYAKIFENQQVWSNNRDAKSIFVTYAKDIGIDVKKFTEDIDSDVVRESVEEDYDGGIDSGVNSTPTFFLKGKKINNPRSYDEFKKLIENI